MKTRKLDTLGTKLSIETVHDFFELVVAPKMQWEPVGIVLHNTETPSLKQWPGVDPHGRKLTVAERLDDMNYAYANIKGWPSGPHCFVDAESIWIFSPPWLPGTGSPSWNKDHFHVVLVGNYAKEIMPRGVRDGGVAVGAAMYKLMGKAPTLKNFHYHREDKKTRHKRCPGANVGPKDQWIKLITKAIDQ